jgi:hypothetical protein
MLSDVPAHTAEGTMGRDGWSVITVHVACHQSFFMMFMAKYHEWFTGNPVFLLKVLGCSWTLMASFTKWTM